MSQRELCCQCHYPKSTCICHAVSDVTTRHRVIILQHPSEMEASKGTVRLIKLCMPDVICVAGESESDFDAVKALLKDGQQPCYLVYPGEDSIAIESLAAKDEPGGGAITLILLDGTWRKVHKILQKNEWLLALPKLSFSNVPESRYWIRKAGRENSLSTLEALAYCINQLDDSDVSPLYKVMDAMMEARFHRMPQNVRERYP